VIHLNPGPSQLSEATLADLREIAASGLLSRSHRSDAFVEVSRAAFQGLRERLAIPPDYRVLYQPSATAAMDTVLRNCARSKTFHFVHGAFSRRFADSAREIGLETTVTGNDGRKGLRATDSDLPPADVDLVAVTHNETANGSMWPLEQVAALRAARPEPLLAVDVTSSFGAMAMRWTDADLWFGSVQKVLGLPAGMGYLVAGPRAFAAALRSPRRVAAWQHLPTMAAKMDAWQTVETPNVLAIALLARQMVRWDLARVEAETRAKADLLYGAPLPWTPWVEDAAWRSTTVLCFRVDAPKRWIERAAAAGFVLGSGYGDLKPMTVRVANFPAIAADDLRRLVEALRA
jgi:phosphoserine aminotransferase